MTVEKPVQKWSDNLRMQAWKKPRTRCQHFIHAAASTFISRATF
jgi:hypothetical protein